MGQQSKEAASSMWGKLCKEFREYHQNTLNVALHLVTTPLGWTGMMKLAHALTDGAVKPEYIAAAHSAVVCCTTDFKSSVGTIALNALTAYLAHRVELPHDEPGRPYGSLALLAAGYLLQDLAHLVTGEQTYQSSYSNPVTFCAHSFYLLPLCVDAYANLRRGALYWMVPRDTTVKTRIADKAALRTLREWVARSSPNKDTTTHWWYDDLKGAEKEAFDAVSNSAELRDAFAEVWDPKAYAVEEVHGMNEVYVASPTALQSSDKVFLMNHVDGPWNFWPFCAVYRVLAAVNENKVVTTHLMELRREAMLTEGDVMGFDFNREIHRVSFDTSKEYNEQRITLKLHYVVYPRVLMPWGKLLAFVTTQYDIIARNLFLYTIKPQTLLQKLSARLGVLLTTYLVERFEALVGLYNCVRAAGIYGLCHAAAEHKVVPKVAQVLQLDTLCGTSFDATAPELFLYATSFVHYLTYIANFYYRSDVNYGRLLRDCKFWKTLSIGQLLYRYAQHDVDAMSVGVAASGYALAASAAAAIGMDRTYFGAELGIVKPQWISAFPYNCVPHPMILGAVVGLGGFHMHEGFRKEYPLLVPMHCALYMLHAAQEHFNIHDKDWRKLQRNACPVDEHLD